MEYAVRKPFSVKGIKYKQGDPIDPSIFSEQKLAQLLNQGWLRPVNINADKKSA